MKTRQILAILGFSAIAMAQSLAPSPTESVGCEPHGDHARHCDILATAVSTSSDVVATTTAHEDSEASSNATLPPSPTGRGECSGHVYHWHCDIPATATASVSTETAAATTAAASGADDSTSSAITVLAGAARAGLGAAAVAAGLLAL
ncbi:hypothetical protein FJTKL_12874 [Diaporthe vaccinii]|uniref:Uncharacterized protein n=1 Tax=Diaporthe vaccinii TaxID=105482 RepID=A0ABR4F9W7_9PEZI